MADLELQEAQRQIAVLNAEKDQLEKENATLRDDKITAQAAVATETAKVEDVAKANEASQAQLVAQAAEIAKLKADLDAQKTAADAAKAETAEMLRRPSGLSEPEERKQDFQDYQRDREAKLALKGTGELEDIESDPFRRFGSMISSDLDANELAGMHVSSLHANNQEADITHAMEADEEKAWRRLRKRDSAIAQEFRKSEEERFGEEQEAGTQVERLIYKFQREVEHNQIPLLLGIFTIILITCGTLFAIAQDDAAFWTTVSILADPGNIGDFTDPGIQMLAFFVALIGVIYSSAVIGFIVDYVIDLMTQLRHGGNAVVVEDHHLILGWSDSVLALIGELAEAMESEGGGQVVVLSDTLDKLQMEEELVSYKKGKQGGFKGTEIICRKGDPQLHSELSRVRAWTAKSIIIIANQGNAEAADTNTVRILLSLRGLQTKLKGHIVTEIRDVDVVPVTEMIGGEKVEPIVMHDIIGRLMIQSIFEPGLSQVWASILGFEGAEFYLSHHPSLNGRTFEEACYAFETATVIGVLRSDTKEVYINPPGSYMLKKKDEIIVIAEDDSSYDVGNVYTPNAGMLPPRSEKAVKPEKILICGWRRDIDGILRLLDFRMNKGSEVHLLAAMDQETRKMELEDNGFFEENLRNIRLRHYVGDASKRRNLVNLDTPLHAYKGTLILADQNYEDNAIKCDSHSLSCLLMVEDLLTEKPEEHSDDHSSNVVTEVLDIRTQELMNLDTALKNRGDFMMSTRITSDTLAMLAENRKVKNVLDKLLSAKGADLSLRRFADFGEQGEQLSIWDLVARCRLEGNILVGYWKDGDEWPTVNPEEKTQKHEWSHDDKIILLKPPPAPSSIDLIREGDTLRKCAGKMKDETDAEKASKKAMYDESIATYGLAIETDPTNALACYGRGVAERKKGDNKAAAKSYSMSLEIDPEGRGGHLGEIGGVVKGAVWDNLAQTYTKLKEHDKAIEAAQKALDLNPKYEKFAKGLKKAKEAKAGKKDKKEKDKKEKSELAK